MKVLVSALAVAVLVTLGGASAAADEGGKLMVSRADCEALVRHVPEPGVAYQPGRDAHGRMVAPADVGGGPSWRVPDSITIDISINLAEKYGIGAGGRFKGEGTVATVTVDTRTGAVLLDGKPVGDAVETEIAKACRETYGK